jgi:hypothetical protein
MLLFEVFTFKKKKLRKSGIAQLQIAASRGGKPATENLREFRSEIL